MTPEINKNQHKNAKRGVRKIIAEKALKKILFFMICRVPDPLKTWLIRGRGMKNWKIGPSRCFWFAGSEKSPKQAPKSSQNQHKST